MKKPYPQRCMRNIRIICNRLCVDADTAYSMLLVTSALMDARPEDDKVVETILTDCNVEVEV